MSKTPLVLSESKNGCLWITLQNTIDMNNYKKTETEITQKILQCTDPAIVIDFIKTAILFSSGIGMLVRLNAAAGIAKKKLCLINVSSKIHEGLVSMCLDRVISIYGSEEEFNAKFQKDNPPDANTKVL